MHAYLIRINEVCRLTGLSRTTVWRRERAGDFPARRRLGSNSVAWVLTEVIAWCEGRQPTQRGEVTRDEVVGTVPVTE